MNAPWIPRTCNTDIPWVPCSCALGRDSWKGQVAKALVDCVIQKEILPHNRCCWNVDKWWKKKNEHQTCPPLLLPGAQWKLLAPRVAPQVVPLEMPQVGQWATKLDEGRWTSQVCPAVRQGSDSGMPTMTIASMCVFLQSSFNLNFSHIPLFPNSYKISIPWINFKKVQNKVGKSTCVFLISQMNFCWVTVLHITLNWSLPITIQESNPVPTQRHDVHDNPATPPSMLARALASEAHS